MKSTLLLVSLDGISGDIFDFIDLYYNMKNFIDCDLKLIGSKTDIINFTKFLYKSYTNLFISDIIKHIVIVDNIDDNKIYKKFSAYDNIIISSKLLSKVDVNITNEFNKVISLMTLRGMFRLNNNNEIINKSNFVYLCTPVILNNINNIKCNFIEYYSRFSQFRLDNIKVSNNNIVFDDYNNYDTLKYNNKFNIHTYSGIIYKRRDFYKENMYLEMKGKLLFEFLYFNKYVYYNSKPKSFDDGLTDYLKYFNIDDNISQQLKITKDELYNKIIKFDNNNDILNILEVKL